MNKVLYLNITSECNSKCNTCFLWNNKDTFQLKTQYWVKAVREFNEYRDKNNSYVHITGGEPLLKYHDCLSIIKACQELNIPCILMTNGSLLTKEKIKELYEIGLTAIRFSVNSHIPEIHNPSRGFKCDLQHIKNIIAYIQESKFNLQILLNMILADFNVDTFIDSINYYKKLHINGLTYNILAHEAFNIHTKSVIHKQDKLKKVVQYLYDNYDLYPFLKNPKWNLLEQIKYIDKREKFQIDRQCLAYSHNTIVLHDGQVQNCYFNPPYLSNLNLGCSNANGMNIGNIKTDSLVNIASKHHFSYPFRKKIHTICNSWCGILDCNYSIF